MKRFCTECGKEAEANHKVCIHCGTKLGPIKKEQVEKKQRTTPKKKQPMSKKNKIIISAVVAVVVLLFGLNTWASSHYSAESVDKRFNQALAAGDAKKIKKLSYHEDGSSIESEEAEALVKLVTEGGSSAADFLYTVPFDKKILGVVDAFKIELIDQFAVYDENIDGLTFEFNELSVEEYEKDDDYIVYGPIAPGIYDIKATFDGDFGEAAVEDELRLSSEYGDYTDIGMDIPITYVNFSIENYDQLGDAGAKLLLGEEEFSASGDGEIEKVGPMIVDGSQTVQTVVTMPWGEVTSEPIEVAEDEMYIHASILEEEQYDTLKETARDFGEQYTEARAEKSTKPLKVASSAVQKMIESDFSEDYHYAGQLNKVEFDKTSLAIDKDSDEQAVKIYVKYMMEEAERYKSKDLSLSEIDHLWDLQLVYKDDQWTVQAIDSLGYMTSFEPTDELDGKKQAYGPGQSKKKDKKDEKDKKSDKSAVSKSDAEEFLIQYTEASVDAINARDFSIVSSFITEDGPRRKEADEYIDYLDSKDIYEEYNGTELEKLEEMDDKTYKATVIEEFKIIRPDSSDVKKFRTVLIMKVVDGELLVDELIETNDI